MQPSLRAAQSLRPLYDPLYISSGSISGREPAHVICFGSFIHGCPSADQHGAHLNGPSVLNMCRYKSGGWSYHEGDASDPRMLEAARKRGVYLTSRSRPLVPEDFSKFDYIIGEPHASGHLRR